MTLHHYDNSIWSYTFQPIDHQGPKFLSQKQPLMFDQLYDLQHDLSTKNHDEKKADCYPT